VKQNKSDGGAIRGTSLPFHLMKFTFRFESGSPGGVFDGHFHNACDSYRH